MNRFNLTNNDHLFAHPTERPRQRPEGKSFAAAARGASRLGLPLAPRPEGADSEDQEGVRWDLIRRLRREIAAGTYASPERWQSALNGLSDDLAG